MFNLLFYRPVGRPVVDDDDDDDQGVVRIDSGDDVAITPSSDVTNETPPNQRPIPAAQVVNPVDGKYSKLNAGQLS